MHRDDVLAYEEHGDPTGPLVLCLHGFPDHAPSYRALGGQLAEAGHRVVAPWMPGYRPAPRLPSYDAVSLGKWVVRAAEHLSPARPVDLVGHDWGAVAVTMATALAPQRFTSATIVSVPHPFAFVANLWRAPSQLARSSYMLAFQPPWLPERLLRARDMAAIDAVWRRWSPDYLLDDDARAELQRCLDPSLGDALAYYRALRRLPGLLTPALRRALATIRVPTLALHGDRDGCVHPALGRDQARFYAAPFASALVAGAGHFVHLEATDEVADRVTSWIARHGEGEPAGP